jgi:Ser/Thr protein kinase RdoA (MazF antagonist)
MNPPAPLVLPVSYSLVSSPALQGQLLPRYALAKGATVSLLAQGMHDTYLVAAPAAKHILRIYRAGWKTFAGVEAELRVLRLLQAQGLPVAYPVADAHGTSIHRIAGPEGERYAVLFAHAEGEKIGALTPAQAGLFGKYVGQMHAITRRRHDGALGRDYSVGSILEGTRRAVRAVLPGPLRSPPATATHRRAARRAVDAGRAANVENGHLPRRPSPREHFHPAHHRQGDDV